MNGIPNPNWAFVEVPLILQAGYIVSYKQLPVIVALLLGKMVGRYSEDKMLKETPALQRRGRYCANE